MSYKLCVGGVQCYVSGFKKPGVVIFHFGSAEYDSKKPILSESERQQAQPIVDALNAGTITEEAAMDALKNIYL